eukprot:3970037-Pyramimonas_sp.AAC.1
MGGPPGSGRTRIQTGPRGPLGGCEPRNCGHSRGPPGSPAGWRQKRIQLRPRGSSCGCEMRNCHFWEVQQSASVAKLRDCGH